MRVLFMSNIPSPYRVAFFNELGKMCELTVTFEGQTATDRNEKWKAERVNNFQAIYLKGVRVTSDSFFCPGIIKILKQTWDKIIIGVYSTPTSMLAIEYLRYKKKKFYIEADGGLIKADRRLVYLIKKHYISAASGWFSSGQMTTDYLVHYGAKHEKCYWYPFTSMSDQEILNAQELCNQNTNILKRRLNIAEKYMILSVGRFSYNNGYGKGYDLLMKAAGELGAEIGIYIVGDDPTEEFLEWKKRECLDNVHFVGFKQKEELAYYYAAADLFVLMTRADVWGLVINEAMTHGLPIITTDCCVAGRELVENGVNGYVISVRDEGELAKRIMEIVRDEEKKQNFGQASLKKIRHYTIEKMAERHIEVLEEMGV